MKTALMAAAISGMMLGASGFAQAASLRGNSAARFDSDAQQLNDSGHDKNGCGGKDGCGSKDVKQPVKGQGGKG